MSIMQHTAIPYMIGDWLIVRLPAEMSVDLPSRGQVMVQGTINGWQFLTAVEPDGRGGHWLHVDDQMREEAQVMPGEPVSLQLAATKDWPEPTIPDDIRAGLVTDPQIVPLWARITPMARWEWIRWIGATGKAETRAKRITVARSKMLKGERRPCCFNRSMCCVPAVSKNGVLLDDPART
jgi:hypothetical protein